MLSDGSSYVFCQSNAPEALGYYWECYWFTATPTEDSRSALRTHTHTHTHTHTQLQTKYTCYVYLVCSHFLLLGNQLLLLAHIHKDE